MKKIVINNEFYEKDTEQMIEELDKVVIRNVDDSVKDVMLNLLSTINTTITRILKDEDGERQAALMSTLMCVGKMIHDAGNYYAQHNIPSTLDEMLNRLCELRDMLKERN